MFANCLLHIGLAFLLSYLPETPIPDDGDLDLIFRFLDECEADYASDQTLESATALTEAARSADFEFFRVLESELRRMRREPASEVSSSSGGDRRAFPPLELPCSILLRAELWSPTLLEFAEESLRDPLTRPEFLKGMASQIAGWLALEQRTPWIPDWQRHTYSDDRVIDFLVEAAASSERRVSDDALLGLSGYVQDGTDLHCGWDTARAESILLAFAKDETLRPSDRAKYLEWLIVIPSPNNDQYVRLAEGFIADPSIAWPYRLSFGERIFEHGYLAEDDLAELREEDRQYRANRSQHDGSSGTTVIRYSSDHINTPRD